MSDRTTPEAGEAGATTVTEADQPVPASTGAPAASAGAAGPTAPEGPAGLTADRPRLSPGRELITMLLGFWLMIGLFVDGWAHNNLALEETFFTPWHALFYSGYLANAVWIVSQLTRNLGDGRPWTAAVPVGYGTGLVGLAVFLGGGAGDMAWHTAFGVEENLDALFSPTHLLLFIGIALIMSCPLRAAWADRGGPLAPSYRQFLPVLLSVTALTALVSFMFMYWAPATRPVGAPTPDGSGGGVAWGMQQAQLATIMAGNLILVAPLLLLARRWRLPLGTATTLFGLVGVLTSALAAFETPELAAGLLVAGVAVDAVLAWLRPATSAPVRFWGAAAAVPLVTWSVYFATVGLTHGIGWSLEMWTGSIMWTGLLGCALGVLMLPPRPGVTT